MKEGADVDKICNMREWFKLTMVTLGFIALSIPAFQPPDEKPLSLCRSWIVPSASDVVAEVSKLPFDLFVEDSYRMYLMRFPEKITALGMADLFGVTDDRLNDYSPPYTEETWRNETTILDLLHRFDRDSLSPAERVTYDVYEWYLEDRVEGQEFSPPFYPMDGPLPFSLPWPPSQLLTESYPIGSRSDVLAYLDRLRRVPTQLDQLKGWLEKAADNGIFIPPNVILSEIPGMLWVVFPEDRSYCQLFLPLRDRIGNARAISNQDVRSYLAAACSIIDIEVIPAYAMFEDWLYELTDSAPERVGMGRTPAGKDYYAFLIRHFTGLDITPEEVYELGTKEVERTQEEIRDALSALGIPNEGPMSVLLARVQSGSGELIGNSLRDRCIALKESARELAADRFALPERDVEIIADRYTRSFYWKAPHDGSSPAEFHFRFDIPRPSFRLASMIYEGTYPGRHLQAAVAQEAALPLLQQEGSFPGFSAGWAAYADDLAAEWGWYDDDPYGYLGHLWRRLERAAIAVYDVSINLKGWGYDRALSYYVEATGKDPYEAALDVYRYGIWPGQGTIGLVGYTELTELRKDAEKKLGARFDLDRFNALLLENGNVPLFVLEGIVERYIESESD